jgi:hypothetical protein
LRFAQVGSDTVYVSNGLIKTEFSADALDLSNGLFEPSWSDGGDGTQSSARLCLFIPTSTRQHGDVMGRPDGVNRATNLVLPHAPQPICFSGNGCERADRLLRQ